MSNTTPRVKSHEAQSRPSNSFEHSSRGVDRESAWTLIVLFLLTAPGSLFVISTIWLSPFAVSWVLTIPGLVMTIEGLRQRPRRTRVGGRLALISLVLLLATAMLHALYMFLWIYDS